MRLSKSGVLLLSAVSFLSVPVGAAELAKGVPVAREFSTQSGDRFLVTVRPGSDRGVDPRVFDRIEITSDARTPAVSAGGSVQDVAHATKSGRNDADDVEVDVSGYRIRIEALSITAASCSATYTTKLSKVSLGGKQSLFVDGSGSASMLTTAFPTKGDVDTYVYDGNTVCSSGENLSGRLDYASCSNTSCLGSDFTGEVYNPFSSSASYVALFRRQFVN